MKTTRTMTNAQMNWNLKQGFAWWASESEEWTAGIYTKDGIWVYDNSERQVWELAS